jgi:hypothetical protein
MTMIEDRRVGVAEEEKGWQKRNAKAGGCADNDVGGGEEYFHVGTKSLQFGNVDGDAHP